jgi:hypothetical protein
MFGRMSCCHVRRCRDRGNLRAVKGTPGRDVFTRERATGALKYRHMSRRTANGRGRRT